MQGSEVGDDLLSLRLSIGGGRKRKRSDEANNKSTIIALLQSRERMTSRLGCKSHEDNGPVQLVRRLLLCAAAVDRRDPISAAESLRQLYRSVSFSGDPIQRVGAYFTEGLAARFLTPNSPFYFSVMTEPSLQEEFSAFASLYRSSPYHQFAHFTANQAIIEAFEAEEHFNGGCLHVIDLDVSYGFQWPSLIQSLSDKATSQKPIKLRITGFGRSRSELTDTETRLSSFAGGCRNLIFEFEARLRGEKLDEEIQTKNNSNATVAVNLVFYLHMLNNYTEISTTLTQIQSMNPSVVTLVEKEGSRSGQSGFLSRFMASLQYFAAMFDSLDDCLPAASKERLRIEKHCLGREIRNAVAAVDEEEEEEEEGKSLRYQMLETWKGVMERNQFEGLRMSSRSVSQAKLLLKIKSHCSSMEEHMGFRISERDEGKALSLGWQNRDLITATAWRPRACLFKSNQISP